MKGIISKAFLFAQLILVIPSFAMQAENPAMPMSIWDRVKSAGNSVANSKLARYAHAAFTAPFDYTIGALASKSGLAERIANSEQIKANTYHSATIGNGLKNVGRYAFGLAALYYAVTKSKAVFNNALYKLLLIQLRQDQEGLFYPRG